MSSPRGNISLTGFALFHITPFRVFIFTAEDLIALFTHTSLNSRTHTHIDTYTEILLALKKRSPDFCYNMDKSGENYIK